VTPDKIKNMIWDKFTSSVTFFLNSLWANRFLGVCLPYICTVYFHCRPMSANLSLYCPFLLIFILVCFCVFYVSCFVCCHLA